MIVLKICVGIFLILAGFFEYVAWNRGKAIRIYKKLTDLEHLMSYKEAADSARELLKRYGGIENIRMEQRIANYRAICFFLAACFIALLIYLTPLVLFKIWAQ